MIQNAFAHILQALLPWVHVVLDVAGIAVAVTYLKTTRWMVLVLAGFTVAAAVGVAMNTVLPRMLQSSDPSAVSTVFNLVSVVGLVAKGTLVAGLAGVFSVWAQHSRTRSMDRN